jgi:hypothetical protein
MVNHSANAGTCRMTESWRRVIFFPTMCSDHNHECYIMKHEAIPTAVFIAPRPLLLRQFTGPDFV